MHTPSLRRRVVATGVAIVALVLVAFDVFLYVTLRSRLVANLDSILSTRARIVQAEAARLAPPALAARLTELGLRADIEGPDGVVHRANPPSPMLESDLPAPERDGARQLSFRRVTLPGGATAVVSARRSGMDRALHRLLVLEVTGSAIAVGVAALLLLRVSERALQPLAHVAAAASRTAAGRRGERLRPDQSQTELGQMAEAYDRMLDTLEGALADARAAQARSRELEERTRRIIETAKDSYVAADASGTIIDWNPQAEQTFAWSRSEVLGRKVADTVVPPDLREAHVAGIERFRATREGRLTGQRVELPARHRDGHLFPVELSLWCTGSGEDITFHAFAHDITSRRAGEEGCSRLASIVEFSNDAILSHSAEGTILTWNGGAERMYGYSAAEAVGQPLSLIVPPHRRHEMDDVWETIEQGRSVPHHETVRRTKSGMDLDVAVTVSPLRDTAGRLIGASSIERDITEQRWLATTLDSAMRGLEETLAQSRRVEEQSRQFLADAAHQLRTPMAGIQASAQALLRAPSPAERDRLMSDLVRETSRAARLVTSLLRMARLDQGEAPAPVRCDVAALCRDEADRARDLAPHLRIAVTAMRFDGRQPALDPYAVREILANLLDNARRHAKQRIDILVEQEANAVAIRVADDGPGVPDELVERIFERFVTLDRRGGSGLGLPIARSLARANGGDLTYEDRCFVIRLPEAVAMSNDLATTSAGP